MKQDATDTMKNVINSDELRLHLFSVAGEPTVVGVRIVEACRITAAGGGAIDGIFSLVMENFVGTVLHTICGFALSLGSLIDAFAKLEAKRWETEDSIVLSKDDRPRIELLITEMSTHMWNALPDLSLSLFSELNWPIL